MIKKLVKRFYYQLENAWFVIKKSMIVSDNSIQAESLGDFFKNPGKKGFNVSKKVAKIVLINPGRALDLTAKIARAAASRNSK